MKKLILLVALFCVTSTYSLAESVITNSTSAIPKHTLTVTEARNLFSLRTTMFSNGTPVKVFLFPKDRLTSKTFIMEVLGMVPEAYYDRLNNQIASGKVTMPVVIEQQSRMIVVVGVTAGALGFINDPETVKQFNTIEVIMVK